MLQRHGGRLGQGSPLVVRQLCFNSAANLHQIYHTNKYLKGNVFMNDIFSFVLHYPKPTS